jgi:HAD superfamily hydrolase (TIGR01490 family)
MTDKKSTAIFDFDGTITTIDSLPHFLFYISSWGKKIGSIILLPVLAAWILKILSSSKAKEMVISYFLKGMREEEFNNFCKKYGSNILPQIIRREALEKIKWHKESGHKLIILSASMENWIKPWALENGFNDVIATRLAIENGKITGKFLTPNCSGEEKIKRLLEHYPDRKNYYFYVYSDSKKDIDLLLLADKSFYKEF